MTFDELYRNMLKSAVTGAPIDLNLDEINPHQLDCLLHPETCAPVLRAGDCACQGKTPDCAAACLFGAIRREADGNVIIDPSLCAGCSSCVEACKSGALTASHDVLPALAAVKNAKGPVYALIAPAFHGQFAADVTPGKLRSAFKALGFQGMVEVALFADVLTLKEALEFDHNIRTEEDYQLTSCCCPMWIAMLKKVYQELMPHVPGAVSPMVAAGRTIKRLHPDAVTIFVGPCIAKKAEAREPDLAGAVDYVLTFQEVRDIFSAADIHPETLEDVERDHSSRAGRIYARAGGVSEAVQATVNRLNPNRDIRIRTRQAAGIPACRAMIEAIRAGERDANFFEGMGCVGGCVGGPKAILDRETGRGNVERYGEQAEYGTPLDNPYVLEMLRQLGFDTVEDFLANSDIFNRALS
ncbi:MAG TPA: [Fe-Fe] hydrogenase large subunit C-terminal domain-containing protein [Candidatus Limiplasma sp.]|nr:[Fe-Fe] hydrogenase large subunit C-terminal domain-containing protein [Candidatus Limiplasma sp.]